MAFSPYAGRPRTLLRQTIAAVLLTDLVVLAMVLASSRVEPFSRADAPQWLLALGGRMHWIAPIATLGAAGAALVLVGRRVMAGAALALASLFVLVESQAALAGGPQRIFFFGGGAMLGWVVGLAVARGLYGPGNSPERHAIDERFAEAAALGMLAAAYVNAVISKLATTGLSFTDMHALRLAVLGHHHFGDTSLLGQYAEMVVQSAWLPVILSAATLIIQLGAPAMLVSSRFRRVTAALLLAFHANVWALTHILFAQAMVLLVAFAGFWPWWIRRPAPQPDAPWPAPHPARIRFVAQIAAPIALLAILLAWMAPIRRYTLAHHGHGQRPRDSPNQQPPVTHPDVPWEALTQLLGGLTPGATIEGWTVVELRRSSDGAPEIELLQGNERFMVQLAARGAKPWPPPAQSERYDLFTRHPGLAPGQRPTTDVSPVLDALAQRIRTHEHALPMLAPR